MQSQQTCVLWPNCGPIMASFLAPMWLPLWSLSGFATTLGGGYIVASSSVPLVAMFIGPTIINSYGPIMESIFGYDVAAIVEPIWVCNHFRHWIHCGILNSATCGNVPWPNITQQYCVPVEAYSFGPILEATMEPQRCIVLVLLWQP